AGDAYRRQGATDNGLSRRDHTTHERNRVSLAEVEAKRAYDGGYQKKSDALVDGHFVPPTLKIRGSSSKLGISFVATFLASVGALNLKLSEATSAPVFHALKSMLYSGHPATFLLVMT